MKLRRELRGVEERKLSTPVIIQDHCMNSINNTRELRAGKIT